MTQVHLTMFEEEKRSCNVGVGQYGTILGIYYCMVCDQIHGTWLSSCPEFDDAAFMNKLQCKTWPLEVHSQRVQY